MKKTLFSLCLLIGVCMAAGAASKPQAGGFDAARPNRLTEDLMTIGRYALLYIPNLLVDATDIFTLEFGVGGVAALEFSATQYAQFGGEHGNSYFLTKGYSRQYGGGYRDSSKFGFICWNSDVSFVSETFGTVRECVIDSPQFSVADYRLDAYRDDDVDFWRLGARVGWLVDIAFGIHPVEIADFLAGVFFVDLKGDNFK